MWGQSEGRNEPEEERESVGAMPESSQNVNMQQLGTAQTSDFNRGMTVV